MTVKRLGRYELLEQLGEGGMGAVWLARLAGAGGFEKLCIVKTVLPAIAKDEEFVSRFHHEGRVLTQLSHGNIAQVMDLSEEDGQLFLALEYVAGVDLSRLAESARRAGEAMPVAVAVALVAQAAEGLGAAHRKAALDGSPLGVVHRDVSPQNIMVSYEGEVKVIDFGIARSEARSRHTAEATVLGKLGYMAPEQASGEVVDHRADQYALGIVLWELLANRPFIRRGTVTEMVVAMASPVPKPLGPLRADVPGSLEAVVLKALAPAPADRFPSTDDFAHALSAELRALGVTPSKPQLGQYVRERCAEAFEAQQVLLTRVSTMRGEPPGERPVLATPPPVAPLKAGSSGLAPTAEHRPSRSHQAALPQPEAPSTGEVLAAVRPSRQPLLIVGLVVVIVALVGALAWVGRGAIGTPAPAVEDAGAVLALVAPEPAPQPAPTVVEAPAGPAPEEPDAGSAEVEAAPPPQPGGGDFPPVEAPPLTGAVRFGGGAYILSNRDQFRWSGCTLTVPGRRVARIGNLAKNASEEYPAGRFRRSDAAPELTREVRVECSQGVGVFRLP